MCLKWNQHIHRPRPWPRPPIPVPQLTHGCLPQERRGGRPEAPLQAQSRHPRAGPRATAVPKAAATQATFCAFQTPLRGSGPSPSRVSAKAAKVQFRGRLSPGPHSELQAEQQRSQASRLGGSWQPLPRQHGPGRVPQTRVRLLDLASRLRQPQHGRLSPRPSPLQQRPSRPAAASQSPGAAGTKA